MERESTYVPDIQVEIRPEFKSLIPPLTPEEYAQLEKNILAEGCRDPLVVWEGENPHCDTEGCGCFLIRGDEEEEEEEGCSVWRSECCRTPEVYQPWVLLDGHNRYEICLKHHIPFHVVEARVADTEDDDYDIDDVEEYAIDWILKNQLGRRNLTPDQASFLRGSGTTGRKIATGGVGAIKKQVGKMST